MIAEPFTEDYEEKLSKKDIESFAKKYEKELKSNDFSGIIKKIEDSGYSSEKDLVLFRNICEEILGEEILNYLSYIPSNLYRNSDITSINIPSNITEIKDEAFAGCSNLKNIVIPDSVTVLGDKVFEDCSALESIKLSEKLTELPNKLFSGCKSLSSVFIPDSVKKLGFDVFKGCNDNMIISLNRGVDRSTGPDDEHPKAIKMKSSTREFMEKHMKWANEK